MRVELLFIAESFEVGSDGEIDYGRRIVGKILLQRLRVNRGSHNGRYDRRSCKIDSVVVVLVRFKWRVPGASGSGQGRAHVRGV